MHESVPTLRGARCTPVDSPLLWTKRPPDSASSPPPFALSTNTHRFASCEDRGSRAEGRGPRAEGRGPRVEGRGSRAEGRGSRAEGREAERPRARGRGREGESRRPRAANGARPPRHTTNPRRLCSEHKYAWANAVVVRLLLSEQLRNVRVDQATPAATEAAPQLSRLMRISAQSKAGQDRPAAGRRILRCVTARLGESGPAGRALRYGPAMPSRRAPRKVAWG
jgi:hypothetical protein